MVRRRLAVAVLALLMNRALCAQTTPAVPAAQLAPAAAADGLLSHFEKDITHVAELMPAEKYDFTPAALHIPGAKFDGVRSFADEVKHVIQANYLIASRVSGSKPAVDMKALGELKSRDQILAALAASFQAAHAAIATITPANANDKLDVKGLDFEASRQSMAAYVATHGYDHYGQLVEYLRMNGISPS